MGHPFALGKVVGLVLAAAELRGKGAVGNSHGRAGVSGMMFVKYASMAFRSANQ